MFLILGHNSTSPDNLSDLNGDDNHKVWSGKTPEPTDPIYGDYGSTLRSFRSNASGISRNNRPRQLTMPSSPPPPPIPEESSKEDKKDSNAFRKKKRSKSREAVDGRMFDEMMSNGNVPRSGGSMINGPRAASALGSRKQSAASLMGAPPRMNGHGPPRGGPIPPQVPPPMMMMPMPNGKSSKKAGTFSARQKKGMPHPIPPFMMYGGPPPPMPPYMTPPPHLMPPPGHPIYAGMPPLVPIPQPGGGGSAMEEPIYMPHNARPISPVASYQPGHFPHEAYYNQQQYATIDKANRYRKNKRSNGNNSGSDKKGKNKAHQSSDSNAEDSEFAAGIYKKGHINERAFSYSIRNEHRSRSYGSLSNMQFGPNGEPLPPGPNGQPGLDEPDNNNRKDREFMQMMSDLELGEDHIERSEVPPGLYPPQGYGGVPPNMVMMADPMVANGPSRKKR